MTFGHEGGSAFAGVENEDVAAITGAKYSAGVNPAGSPPMIRQPRSCVCILGCALQYSKKSGIPLPDSSGSFEEVIRGVRSA